MPMCINEYRCIYIYKWLHLYKALRTVVSVYKYSVGTVAVLHHKIIII